MDKLIIIKDGEKYMVDTSRINITISDDKSMVSLDDKKNGADLPLLKANPNSKFRCTVSCDVSRDFVVEAKDAIDAREKVFHLFSDYDIGQCVRNNIKFGEMIEVV